MGGLGCRRSGEARMPDEAARQWPPIRAKGILPSGEFGLSSGVIPGKGRPGGGLATGTVATCSEWSPLSARTIWTFLTKGEPPAPCNRMSDIVHVSLVV